MYQTKTISDQKLKLMLSTHVQEKLIALGRERGRGYYFCQATDPIPRPQIREKGRKMSVTARLPWRGMAERHASEIMGLLGGSGSCKSMANIGEGTTPTTQVGIPRKILI